MTTTKLIDQLVQATRQGMSVTSNRTIADLVKPVATLEEGQEQADKLAERLGVWIKQGKRHVFKRGLVKKIMHSNTHIGYWVQARERRYGKPDHIAKGFIVKGS